MKFQTDKIADISSNEIEDSDLYLLASGKGEVIFTGTHGYVLYMSEFDEPTFKRQGFSYKFLNIYKEACKQKIRYIRFDADGAEIKH